VEEGEGVSKRKIEKCEYFEGESIHFVFS